MNNLAGLKIEASNILEILPKQQNTDSIWSENLRLLREFAIFYIQTNKSDIAQTSSM